MSTSHIWLFAGHDIKRQGAQWGHVTEWLLSEEVLDRIRHPRIKILENDLDLIASVRAANMDPDCLLAAELHFNAGGTSATQGCETLYCPGSTKGLRAAQAFQKAYLRTEERCNGVRTSDRGVKEGWYRMQKNGSIDYFLRATAMPAIILEPEFIQQAAAWFHNETYLQEVAKAIETGLLAAADALEK